MSKSFREERSVRARTEERLHNKAIKHQRRKLHEEDDILDSFDDEHSEELLLHSNLDLSRL